MRPKMWKTRLNEWASWDMSWPLTSHSDRSSKLATIMKCGTRVTKSWSRWSDLKTPRGLRVHGSMLNATFIAGFSRFVLFPKFVSAFFKFASTLARFMYRIREAMLSCKSDLKHQDPFEEAKLESYTQNRKSIHDLITGLCPLDDNEKNNFDLLTDRFRIVMEVIKKHVYHLFF